LEKKYRRATFPTIDPTLSDLVLNVSRRCKKPPLTALAMPRPMRAQDNISKLNNGYKQVMQDRSMKSWREKVAL
jgi:hypothetical protein